jgi:hypothetical protein
MLPRSWFISVALLDTLYKKKMEKAPLGELFNNLLGKENCLLVILELHSNIEVGFSI